MKRILKLALAAAMALTPLAPVWAAPGKAKAGEGPMLVVVAPPARLTPGETRRYRFETTTVATAPGRPEQREETWSESELTVVSADEERVVMRYVMRSYGAAPDPLYDLVSRALTGQAVVFQADPSGKPIRVVNWPELRERLKTAAAKDPAGRPDDVAQLNRILDRIDETSAVEAFIGEVRTVAEMQSWPPFQGMRLDDPDWSAKSGDERADLYSFRQIEGVEGCVAILRRETGLKPSSPVAKTHGQHEKLTTVARVSQEDGWVLSVEEIRARGREGAGEIKTIKARRLEAPGVQSPTCGASPR